MICMEDDRLTKQIFKWDKTLNDRGIVSGWSNELKMIFNECNFNLIYEMSCPFDLKYVVSNITEKFKTSQINYLANECDQKPKLRILMKHPGTPKNLYLFTLGA